MVKAIPPALKAADIARFAQRAGQVEKAKPVVAYWCYYWIIEQILSKRLHQNDDESKSYTMDLMDKLEQTRSDFKDNDAITDDVAGQAYIEQFALETFQRAENAMKVNRASRQTADTFQAAAAFLDLCQIWGPLEPEIASKIKFAKYHSLRILKAIKVGEDPNLSNPAPEPEEGLPLDPNDPEVQILNHTGEPLKQQTRSCQPTVVEVPDEQDQFQGSLAQKPTYDESSQTFKEDSLTHQPSQKHELAPKQFEEAYYQNAGKPDVSPTGPASTNATLSGESGYFPSVPADSKQAPSETLPGVPPTGSGTPPENILPDPSSLPPPGASGFHTSRPPTNNSIHSFPPPNMDDPEIVSPASASIPYDHAAPSHRVHPAAVPRQLPQTPASPLLTVQAASVRHEGPRDITPPSIGNQASYSTDEDSILKAQKHARWAISALNFEDVNTAVNELRGALESLGAK